MVGRCKTSNGTSLQALLQEGTYIGEEGGRKEEEVTVLYTLPKVKRCY